MAETVWGIVVKMMPTTKLFAAFKRNDAFCLTGLLY